MQSSPTKRNGDGMETETTDQQPARDASPKRRRTNKKQGESKRFKLDQNTANGSLALSQNNTRATYAAEVQSHPAHPDRFDFWQQAMCGGEGLSGPGRWFWEVEVTGWVSVGVAYGTIARGRVDGALLGRNARSWSLAWSECDRGGGSRYTACHDNTMIEHRRRDDSSGTTVIGVFLDWAEGDLTFYRMSTKGPEMLHTFSTKFTAPLYPAFRLGWRGSSVSLLQLQTM